MHGLPDWAGDKMRRDNVRRCRADILLVHALSALEVGLYEQALRRLHQIRIHTELRARGEPIANHRLEPFLLPVAPWAEYHHEPAATSREEER